MLTIALTYVIASRLFRGKGDPTHVGPAWLIPGVATLDIAVAGGTMPMAWAPELNPVRRCRRHRDGAGVLHDDLRPPGPPRSAARRHGAFADHPDRAV
ncbi:hypothetical protein ACTMU2_24505 [Cupriavidus basilensis]